MGHTAERVALGAAAALLLAGVVMAAAADDADDTDRAFLFVEAAAVAAHVAVLGSDGAVLPAWPRRRPAARGYGTVAWAALLCVVGVGVGLWQFAEVPSLRDYYVRWAIPAAIGVTALVSTLLVRCAEDHGMRPRSLLAAVRKERPAEYAQLALSGGAAALCDDEKA